jgi:putative glutathione S-transferase
VFRETALSTPDLSGTDFTSLHEAYCASQADYTGKITVPVLWDRKLHRIVNNEFPEIVEMLNQAFDGIGGTAQIDLYPPALRSEIDALNLRTTRSVATGVYAVAGARDQAEYEETATICELLLAVIEKAEEIIGRAIVLADQLTLADILVFTPLVRFDAVHNRGIQ